MPDLWDEVMSDFFPNLDPDDPNDAEELEEILMDGIFDDD